MQAINNNRSSVWSAVGRGAVIGAATATVATSIGLKTVAKKPSVFMQVAEKEFAKAGTKFNEPLSREFINFMTKFKYRGVFALLAAAPIGAFVGTLGGGVVGAIAKGVKSLCKGKDDAAKEA